MTLFRPSVLAAALALALATVSGLPAQAAAAQAQTQTLSFDLPAGPLADSLNAIARQGGLVLALDPALVRGRRAAPVRGAMTPEQALTQVLAGSGLMLQRTAGGNFSVQPPPADGAAVLPALRISAVTVAQGGTAQGYRSDELSSVGPWQGRELQDTPYTLTVISKDLIENLQAVTPDQVLRINPTTQLTRSQHENDQPTFFMRGFRVSTGYQDGVPLDQLGHGTTTEDAERIEILSGLSGFLYGAGNVGGVVNYVTKRPTAERLTRLTLGNSGGNNYYLHGDFGGPIDAGGRFGYRLNAIAQDGETAVDNQQIRKQFFSGAFDWRITDNLLLQLSASRRDYEVDAKANWAFASGVARLSPAKLDSDQAWGQRWAESYYENTKYGARLQWDANDALTLRAAWYENRNERGAVFATNTVLADGTYNQAVYGYYPSGIDPMTSRHDDAAGYLFGDLRFATGPVSHQLTAGIQRRQSTDARFANNSAAIVFNGLPPGSPSRQPRPQPVPVERGPVIEPFYIDDVIDNLVVGDDITFNGRWSLLLGAARTTIDAKLADYRESAVTPTASLLFKPLPALTTYISYIESLEQGGAAADEFNGAPVINTGEVMEPLLSRQLEIGAKASLGGLLVTAALFEIDKGLQYYDIADPARPEYVQDGRQVHRGVELTLVGKASERLTLIGGATWLDAEVREQKQSPALQGNRPALVSDVLAKLRAEYRLSWLEGVTLVGGVHYASERYADAMNTDRLAGYTLVDAGARYETRVGGVPLTLRLEANNLTDKRYWANNSVVGDPRAVVFSASVDL